MNDEQFEQEQLDRDNAYKQALARVEAERDEAREFMRINAKSGLHYAEQRDALKAQLAEAVVMLHRYQELVSTIDMGSTTAPTEWCSHFRNEVKRRTVELGDFLTRHAKEEKQEARAALATQAAVRGDEHGQ